ncbi:MAG: type II toxin-antitoxin system HicB family antitoxin [Desulfitobacteriaceae bacterium]|nr:type II toxin-antitoxin system HicB family antitoxin [Desulfitobacteriaceae bacterium]
MLYYLGLPYKYSIYPAQEGGYVIEIPDLPGCISQGETVEEAVSMIEDAKKFAIIFLSSRSKPSSSYNSLLILCHKSKRLPFRSDKSNPPPAHCNRPGLEVLGAISPKIFFESLVSTSAAV